MHTIVLPLPAGDHVISLRGRASPLRSGMFFFSLFATALILGCPAALVECAIRSH
jgi:hypothetical protein